MTAAGANAASTNAARAAFYYAASSLIVASFALWCLPLGIISPRLGLACIIAYRTGFLAAAVAHGYRIVFTMRPKLAASGTSVAALQAAAPALARELLGSNAFLVRSDRGRRGVRRRAVVGRRADAIHPHRVVSSQLRCFRFAVLRVLPAVPAQPPHAAGADARRVHVARASVHAPGARTTHATILEHLTSLCAMRHASRRCTCACHCRSRTLLLLCVHAFVRLQAKNPPSWALYAKYGRIADEHLNAALPTALAMCATAQTMVGLTLIFSLFTRQREVVRSGSRAA
jgi:hypothetical protein